MHRRIACGPARFACLLAIATTAAAGCGGDDGSSATQPRWLAGDFHVHSSAGSNDTRYPDGSLQSWPETIRDVAAERGLSFVVITDHSNSTGSDVSTQVENPALWNLGPEFPLWDEAAGLSDDDLLVINGNEISPVAQLDAHLCPDCESLGTERPEPRGHVGCIPESLDGFDRSGFFVDRPPGDVSGGSAVAACRNRGGFTIVNHPFPRATPWLEYDWTDYDYDALEVYNGSIGWDLFDRSAYDAYLCDRLAGRNVVAVGGSDNHRAPIPYEDDIGVSLGSPLGLPLTSVYSNADKWPAILDAVRAGRIVMHEMGTFVEIEALDGTGDRIAGIGDRVSADDVAEIVLRGRSPRAQKLRLAFAAPGSCTERRTPGRDLAPTVAVTPVTEIDVCPDGACEFTERVAIDGVVGLWFATVGEFDTRSLGVRDVAVTNVLTME